MGDFLKKDEGYYYHPIEGEGNDKTSAVAYFVLLVDEGVDAEADYEVERNHLEAGEVRK